MTDGKVTGGDFLKQYSHQTYLELIAGFVVVIALAVLIVFAVFGRHQKSDDGYNLRANFSHIDGLDVGSDVRLAGVTVGHVTKTMIDPKTFQANVTFSVMPSIKLPLDSGAIITSDSLLGGKYIALTPGGDDKLLESGSVMQETQGSISLEQLLSKFIFAVTNSLQKQNDLKAKAAHPDALQ